MEYVMAARESCDNCSHSLCRFLQQQMLSKPCISETVEWMIRSPTHLVMVSPYSLTSLLTSIAISRSLTMAQVLW